MSIKILPLIKYKSQNDIIVTFPNKLLNRSVIRIDLVLWWNVSMNYKVLIVYWVYVE